jgi:hypothetical protein
MKRGYIYKNGRGATCHVYADPGDHLQDEVTYWRVEGEGRPQQITYNQYRNSVKKALEQFNNTYKTL